MEKEYVSLEDSQNKVKEKKELIKEYKLEIAKHQEAISDYKGKIKELEDTIKEILKEIDNRDIYIGNSAIASKQGKSRILVEEPYHEELTIKITETFYINIYTYKVWKASWSKDPTRYCKCIILNKFGENRMGRTIKSECKIYFPYNTNFNIELLTKYGLAINALMEEARTLSTTSERLIEVVRAEYNLIEAIKFAKNAKEKLEEVESTCGIKYDLNNIDYVTSMKTRKDNFIFYKDLVSSLEYNIKKKQNVNK